MVDIDFFSYELIENIFSAYKKYYISQFNS